MSQNFFAFLFNLKIRVVQKSSARGSSKEEWPLICLPLTPNLSQTTQSPGQWVPIHVMVHYLAGYNSHRSQKMCVQTPLFCLDADEALPCTSKLVKGEHRITEVNQPCQVWSLVFHLQVFKWRHKILDIPPRAAVKVKELFWVTVWNEIFY